MVLASSKRWMNGVFDGCWFSVDRFRVWNKQTALWPSHCQYNVFPPTYTPFEKGIYNSICASRQCLMARCVRACVCVSVLSCICYATHQGKWLHENSLSLYERAKIYKFVYCVLREHLFQFNANKTMEITRSLYLCLSFVLFGICFFVLSSPHVCMFYFGKWAGAFTVNRMCVIQMMPNAMNWAVNFTTKCQTYVETKHTPVRESLQLRTPFESHLLDAAVIQSVNMLRSPNSLTGSALCLAYFGLIIKKS